MEDWRSSSRRCWFVTEEGIKGGFKSLGERIKDARRVIGMVKYVAKRSGSKFVVAREGW